jgi:single-stranded-DNA-specific exonuclease
MNRIWRSRERLALAKGLAKTEANLPDLVSRFLLAREIQDAGVLESLFQPKLQNLSDPFLLKGMRQAVDRLVRAFQLQEKVCLYADFDLDGTSGLALLWEAMETLGFQNLVAYQPKRLSEGYGFHASAVEELSREGVSVIVTVDVGITAFEAAGVAKDKGIDVLLTDHHLPVEKLPDVYALVNPNQGTCESGLGYLCGAGVAFYLVRALKRGLVDAGLIQEDVLPLKNLLDFLTIATLTDMVPLIGDNRALVRQGLLQLSGTKRPGLRVLLEELGLYGKNLTSQDVAVKFAPKLNALSRMETGLRPIDLFRADSQTAAVMVEQVLENNSARVEFQNQGENRAFELLENWPHEKFIFLASEEFHRGVVGLIATKVSGQKGVPVFIGSKGADGFIVGSARLPAGSELNLLDALSAVGGHLTRFGGHSGAAGFECAVENVERVIGGLAQFFADVANRPSVKVVDYDLDLKLEEITPNIMKWFENLGPFGQGFAQPLFCLSEVTIRDSKVLRGGHRKLWIENPATGKSLEALYFSPPSSLRDEDIARGQTVGLLGELQWNDFAGQRSLQFLVRDLLPMSRVRTAELEEVTL